MGKAVTTIPATISRYTAAPLASTKKRRVAAYARVSTDKEEQQNSYEAQVDYYTHYIQSRPDWSFVGVYSDEGTTGCNTKKRDGFNSMVEDALDGKIDLIVTKSVSRFARNTVDSLSTIRTLKEHGTEVYFEKENIWTFDSKGELLLTIMSSLAQEESRSISENCTWGWRKRCADGKVSVPFGRFLGYDRGEDGSLVVNEEQAKLVRRIYSMFLTGYSPAAIARTFTAEGIPTPGGKENWNASCIRSMLTNEKYKGDALLQKVYTKDFLTKEKKKNEGEVPQYYVHGSHEAIIDPKTWDLVQTKIAGRAPRENRYNSVSIYSGRIKCGDCGSWYGSKVWHSNSKYRGIIWRCNHKYDGEKCTTPKLTEGEIQGIFLRAVNKVITERDRLISVYETALLPEFYTADLEQKLSKVNAELNLVGGQIQDDIKRNASVVQDQEAYRMHMTELETRQRRVMAKKEKLEAEITALHARQQEIELYLDHLRQQDLITVFRVEDWLTMVDYVTVYSAEDIRVTFKDGTEVMA